MHGITRIAPEKFSVALWITYRV